MFYFFYFLLIVASSPISKNSEVIKLVETDEQLRTTPRGRFSYFALCAPSLSLEILVRLRNIKSVSTHAIDLFSMVKPSRRKSLSETALSAIAKEFEAQKDWKELFSMSKYAPLLVLNVLWNSNDHNSVSSYLKANIESMRTSDKLFFYKNLVIAFKVELLDPEMIIKLKNGLEENDVLELEQLEELVYTQQCKICTEKSITEYFSCLDAQKYYHGACRECFDFVHMKDDAACPWCREPVSKTC